MNWRLTLGSATFSGVLVAVILPALSHATASGRNGEIALTRRVHGILQVFTVRPDGTLLRQVTHGQPAAEHGGLAWSPNGRGLLYTVDRIDGTERIVKSLADGSGAAVVSPPCTGACLSDDGPTYSPDGKKIVFARAFGPVVRGDPTHFVIFTMDADGSHPTQLTQKSTSKADSQPQWSPDGTKIAFVHTTNTTNESKQKGAIEIMNVDGSNVRRITPFRIDAFDPHWSPNGKRLLFSTYAHPVQLKSANLFTMKPDGKDRVALTHYRGGTLQAFADGWSPDGKEVLFRRMASLGNSEVGGYYILNLRLNHIFDNARGRHIRRLTPVRLRYDGRAAWGPRAG